MPNPGVSLLLATRPKGLKPAQISPLTKKGIFRLDARSDFWEARDCHIPSFPQASPQRLACVVSGVWSSFQNGLNRTRAWSYAAVARDPPQEHLENLRYLDRDIGLNHGSLTIGFPPNDRFSLPDRIAKHPGLNR